MKNKLTVNLDQAAELLAQLDGSSAEHSFQSFSESPAVKAAARGGDPLAKTFHGTLDEAKSWIQRSQDRGAGIFFTVQKTDGKGRKVENITRIRAIFRDYDGDGPPPNLPIKPNLTVCSGLSSRFHDYFFVEDGLSEADFKALMRVMVNSYGSDKNAVDLPRVLRLPGTYNLKNDQNLLCHIAEYGPQESYTREQLFAAFRPQLIEEEKAFRQKSIDSTVSDEDLDRIREALGYIPPHEYEVWIKIGMALKHELGDQGFVIWRGWSALSTKFEFSGMKRKWKSL